jgi:hypothetical protein
MNFRWRFIGCRRTSRRAPRIPSQNTGASGRRRATSRHRFKGNPVMSHDPSAADARIERLAHRNAKAKMGWVIHALVYVCVNAGLALLAWQGGRPAPALPLAGWGLGLAIHGLAVWLKTGAGGGLYARQLRIERERLLRRDAQTP